MDKLKQSSKKVKPISKESDGRSRLRRSVGLKETEKWTRNFIRRYRKDLEALAKK